MPKLHTCGLGGRLVGAARPLPEDPAAYGHPDAGVYVGCSRLVCDDCGYAVRQQPGVEGPEHLKPHLAALARTEDWRTLPGFEESTSSRLYVCACRAWQEDSGRFLDDPEDDDPVPVPLPPWRCGGHPLAELPMSVDGERIDAGTDWTALVERVVDGWAPGAASATERELRVSWLTKLYSWLLDTPHADALAGAVSAVGATDREGAAGAAMLFYRRFPRAPGFQVVLDRARREGPDADLEFRYADRMSVATPREALLARVRSVGQDSDEVDRSCLELLREELLRSGTSVSWPLLQAAARADGEWLAWHAPGISIAHPEATAGILDTLRALKNEDLLVIAGVAMAKNPAVERARVAAWVDAPGQAGQPYALVIGQALAKAGLR